MPLSGSFALETTLRLKEIVRHWVKTELNKGVNQQKNFDQRQTYI